VLGRLGIGLAIAALALASSCLLDFETYDPRLGDASSTSMSAGGAGGAAGSTSTTTSTGGAGGEPPSGGGGSGGSGGSVPIVVEYTASVADCIYVAAPDPDVCLADQGGSTMGVDLDNDMMQEVRSYLRFDIDDQLAGRQIVDVTLQITVSDLMNAGSPGSGVVHEVSPFTRMDLFGAVPTNGPQLAGDQGAVVQSMLVEWTLPTATVVPDTPVYLGVVPTLTEGIDYWNNAGMVPPRLVVTAQ
jgi:hypothetical protein